MSSPFFSAARKSSPVFQARFPGICENCQDGFEPGEDVMYEDNQLVHADPDECSPAQRSTSDVPVCKKCFLVHAGDCF